VPSPLRVLAPLRGRPSRRARGTRLRRFLRRFNSLRSSCWAPTRPIPAYARVQFSQLRPQCFR